MDLGWPGLQTLATSASHTIMSCMEAVDVRLEKGVVDWSSLAGEGVVTAMSGAVSDLRWVDGRMISERMLERGDCTAANSLVSIMSRAQARETLEVEDSCLGGRALRGTRIDFCGAVVCLRNGQLSVCPVLVEVRCCCVGIL